MLLFGEAFEAHMNCVIDILEKFCKISGQQVSQEKTSIIFSKNVDRGKGDRLMQIYGFKETHVLGRYLGVPMTGRMPRINDYQYVIEQVSSKLMPFKPNKLSFLGLVTLAKSVIAATPVYPMITASLPKSCLDDIQ